MSIRRVLTPLMSVLASLWLVVALVIPGVARASTPFDSLPPPHNSIPPVPSLGFMGWAYGHPELRLKYSLQATRSSVYYVAQGTNNSADGLTVGTPRLCATPKDLNDFITATAASGNVEYKLRRGDIWRPTSSLKTGLAIAKAAVTLSSYAPAASNQGDRAPEITGFKAAYGASGWSDSTARGDANTNVWSRAETDTVYWVRGGDAANLDSFLRTPYARVLTGANLAAQISNLNSAGERAWFWVGNVLYVNPGAGGSAELARIESCISTTKGINLGNYDDLLVRDINVTGWGMTTDNSQLYNIHSNATGTNQHTIYRCGAWWSAHHLLGLYAGAAGDGNNPGGILLVYNCRFGLGIHHSSGSTMGVGYNGDGSDEVIFAFNTVTHGALRTETYRTETGYGIGILCHTSGTYKHRLALLVGNTYEDPTTNKLGGINNIFDVDQVGQNSIRDWSKYRGFIVGDRCVGRIPVSVGNFDPFGYFYVRVNGMYRLGAQTVNAQGAYSIVSAFGVAINCIYDVDASGITTASNFAFLNAPNTSPNQYDLINCHIRMGGKASQGLMIDRDSPEGGQSLTCAAYNSIFEGVGSDIFYINLPNADARTSTGGQAGCAYANVKRADTGGFASGWSSAGAAIDLGGELSHTNGMGLTLTGVPLPSEYGPSGVEYDRFGRQRLGTPSVGPGRELVVPQVRVRVAPIKYP